MHQFVRNVRFLRCRTGQWCDNLDRVGWFPQIRLRQTITSIMGRLINAKPVSASITESYSALIRRLATIKSDGEEPRSLSLSPDATDRFYKLQYEVEGMLGDSGRLRELRDWGGKLSCEQTKRLLVEFFGETHPLRSITLADADCWKRWMLAEKGLAIATVSKHGKKAKTMFQHAVRDRLLLSSPFAEMKGGSECNPERQFFITRDVASKVSEACPVLIGV